MFETEFAPAARAPQEVVRRQAETIAAQPFVPILLNSMLNRVLVLNEQRQIVFASQNFQNLLGQRPPGEVLGLRPGEALDCVHCHEGPGGCGTSRFCSECGAVKAFLTTAEGHQGVEECRLRRNTSIGPSALDLLVFGAPLDLNGERFILYSVLDISHEKRRRALERIFFHDLINAAGGLDGLAGLVLEDSQGQVREEAVVLKRGLHEMLEDILAQKDLAAAESRELAVHPAQVRTRDLVEQAIRVLRHHPTATGRRLDTSDRFDDAVLVTDPLLLRRILGNLIRNALEASEPGHTVTVGCADQGETVRFFVHNSTCMPTPVQLQVFNRSFSTKGAGRGLGTYSVKLLTESYLNGKAGFISTQEHGTEFFVTLPKEFPNSI